MNEILHLLSRGIGAIGVVVIVYGVLLGLGKWIVIEIKQHLHRCDMTEQRHALRCQLGYYLLLCLEFLIAADILETIIKPSLEDLAILGAITVIRTVISFSLNWELSQKEKQVE